MYYFRYALTFASEYVYRRLTGYSTIQCLGYKQGSHAALLDWCCAWSKYSADWCHPLWICVRRDRFPDWMNEA